MKSRLAMLGALGLVLLRVGALLWLDFKIWRVQHPAAPKWSYLFSS